MGDTASAEGVQVGVQAGAWGGGGALDPIARAAAVRYAAAMGAEEVEARFADGGQCVGLTQRRLRAGIPVDLDGVLRAVGPGTTWELVVGGAGAQRVTDVAVTAEGACVAAVVFEGRLEIGAQALLHPGRNLALVTVGEAGQLERLELVATDLSAGAAPHLRRDATGEQLTVALPSQALVERAARGVTASASGGVARAPLASGVAAAPLTADRAETSAAQALVDGRCNLCITDGQTLSSECVASHPELEDLFLTTDCALEWDASCRALADITCTPVCTPEPTPLTVETAPPQEPCTPCVATVCAADPVCCGAFDGHWDALCVLRSRDVSSCNFVCE